MVVLLAGVAVSAAPATPASPAPPSASTAQRAGPASSRPSLAVARRLGRDHGRVAASTPVEARLILRGRDQDGLDRLVATNPHLGAAEYAARFGPAPADVDVVRRVAAVAGMASQWTPGDATVQLQGAAGAAERLFATPIDAYTGPDGTGFYAPIAAPVVPGPLRRVATVVLGLDSYPVPLPHAVPAGGVRPQDVVTFYDMSSVRRGGLDGTGMTVMLPESAPLRQADLDAYAAKFGLPPFHLDTRRDPSWGQLDDSPESRAEASLDVEVVHAIAPGAREVVYEFGGTLTNLVTVEEQMVHDTPGGIISSSIGPCEGPDLAGLADAFGKLTEQAAAQGITFIDASGDTGAYGCAREGDTDSLLVSLPNSSPFALSVGGTTVFLGRSSIYFREAAWGEPLEFAGGGGGLSHFYARPDWQHGPGVDNQWSDGMRQVPDVAALGDSHSGWDIVVGGGDEQIGGTSAGAPLWAAIIALIDQDLAAKQLKSIGFANPVLYYFGQNAATLPAPPYHDIVDGNNLYYPATRGWDFATGWGSPDVAALVDDWEFADQHHAAGT